MSLRERAAALLLFALLIGGWEIAARRLGLSALVLPPPSRVAQALWQGLASGYLWPHLGATGIELLGAWPQAVPSASARACCWPRCPRCGGS